MTLLLIIGVALAAVTARLAVHAIALPRLQLRRSLRELAEYGYVSGAQGEGNASRATLSARLARLAERVGGLVRARVPAVPALDQAVLAAAGFYELTADVVHGYRILAAATLGIVFSYIGFVGMGVSMVSVLLVVGATAAGWQLPAVAIKSRGRKRLDRIDAELPELIDLMIATVEAGMGFGASLGLVADKLEGPLGAEVRMSSRQQSLGISTAEALEEMLERCDTQAMRAFVRTVVRGEQMGLSIAPILRELTNDMRRRRRQTAQERMHKAPVKILFPLMFLVMPALFIVLFFPAGYSILTGLKGMG
jgi:tight adherence protein C